MFASLTDVPQVANLRESYDRDMAAAKKAAFELEARLVEASKEAAAADR